MKIAALGRTQMLYDSIELLNNRGHDIDPIITCNSAPEYRVDSEDFENLAAQLDVKYFETTDLSEPHIKEALDNCSVGISVNWRSIIPESILDIFDHGILNAHAGNLPKYRGNAAPNWAIINGEEEIVITIHKMVKEIDAGPIFDQRTYMLTSRTRIGDIYEFLYQSVPDMYDEIINKLETGEVNPEAQPTDPSKILRCYPRKPQDSRLDWGQSADHLDRIVRASSEPLFGAYTFLRTSKLIVWRAHPEIPGFDYLGTPGQVAQRRVEEGTVAIVTGDGFLVLDEVELEDGRRSQAADVITSNRTRLGLDIEDLR